MADNIDFKSNNPMLTTLTTVSLNTPEAGSSNGGFNNDVGSAWALGETEMGGGNDVDVGAVGELFDVTTGVTPVSVSTVPPAVAANGGEKYFKIAQHPGMCTFRYVLHLPL